jgi:hypothetical protein
MFSTTYLGKYTEHVNANCVNTEPSRVLTMCEMMSASNRISQKYKQLFHDCFKEISNRC